MFITIRPRFFSVWAKSDTLNTLKFSFRSSNHGNSAGSYNISGIAAGFEFYINGLGLSPRIALYAIYTTGMYSVQNFCIMNDVMCQGKARGMLDFFVKCHLKLNGWVVPYLHRKFCFNHKLICTSVSWIAINTKWSSSFRQSLLCCAYLSDSKHKQASI